MGFWLANSIRHGFHLVMWLKAIQVVVPHSQHCTTIVLSWLYLILVEPLTRPVITVAHRVYNWVILLIMEPYNSKDASQWELSFQVSTGLISLCPDSSM